jgi:DNA-binding transcriptional LysR family regulator
MAAFLGIEAFARVVETGSFTAAAAAMQTAKSSVSETVRGLEERLGVRLLDRTTRRVRPTEAGVAFYQRCRRMLEEEAQARADIRALRDTPRGRLRIATPEGFARRHLIPNLPDFLAAHPDVEIELIEAAGFARLVDEGIDLAIRISRSVDPGWVVRRLATSEVVVVAAPGYLAAFGTPEAPQDILRHRLVGYALLNWRETWLLGEATIPVRPALLTNSTESLRHGAVAGVGLTALPRWMVADLLASGQVRQVLADFPAPTSGIYAVFPTNRLLAPLVRGFVDSLVRDLRARGLPP